MVPGTHKYEEDWKFPSVDNPAEMPGHVKMAFPARHRMVHARAHLPRGTSQRHDSPRRVLIYSYGHLWMKPWQGYEPSPELQAKADSAVMRQLLHVGDPYRYEYKLDDDASPTRSPPTRSTNSAKRQKQGKGLR